MKATNSIENLIHLVLIYSCNKVSLSYFNREVKIDCIRVNNGPVKSAIDDHISRLFEALLSSLRKATMADVGAIDSFLSDAMEALSTRPQTVEEIGDANARHAEFAKKKNEVSISLCTVGMLHITTIAKTLMIFVWFSIVDN